MRARDIKPDTEYFYHVGNDWLKGYGGERAVVVDATTGIWYMNRDKQWERSPIRSGQEVLVDIYPAAGRAREDSTPHQPRRAAVRTVALRGTWDECIEQRRAYVAEKEAARQAHETRVAEVELPCVQAAAALRQLGINAADRSNGHKIYAEVWIPHRSAARLLAAAQHLIDTGWTPPAE